MRILFIVNVLGESTLVPVFVVAVLDDDLRAFRYILGESTLEEHAPILVDDLDLRVGLLSLTVAHCLYYCLLYRRTVAFALTLILFPSTRSFGSFT